MRTKLFLTVLIVLFATGCTNTDKNSGADEENNNVQHTRYETDQEQTQRHNKEERQDGEKDVYPKEQEKRLNAGQSGGQNKDIFNNDESAKVSERLTDRSEIKQAQVASTDDRVIVAVILSQHADRNKILDIIENETKQIVPEKEIVIYTDDIYWDRMKDLGSQLKSITDDDDVDKYINEHMKK